MPTIHSLFSVLLLNRYTFESRPFVIISLHTYNNYLTLIIKELPEKNSIYEGWTKWQWKFATSNENASENRGVDGSRIKQR
jgi:hypothetical protein